MSDAIIRRFDRPDETRSFEMGKFDLVKIGDLAVGRASYEPGWKWSTHVGPIAGTKSCQDEHIASGHDSWVEGAEPYMSLHFLGAERYAP